MDAKKIWKKTGFGILFVAACFIAMYILMEFHGKVLMVGIAAALLLIAAFLFLNEVFSDKAKKWAPQEEEDAPEEKVSVGGDGEFHLKITKHMKDMENIQKEMLSVLKNQNSLLQNQIENLEHEIYMLSEKQMNQTKSVIKFNKENARQLAISERETLEYVMMELKKAIEDTAGGVRVSQEQEEELDLSSFFAAEQEIAAPVNEPEKAEPEKAVLEEVVAEAQVPVSELPGDDEFVMPEMPDDIDLSELFDIPELFDEPAAETPQEEVLPEVALQEESPMPEPVEESTPMPEVTEEPAPVTEEKTEEPAADPLAGLGGDPNAMMTPEDIAKLLAAMGQ